MMKKMLGFLTVICLIFLAAGVYPRVLRHLAQWDREQAAALQQAAEAYAAPGAGTQSEPVPAPVQPQWTKQPDKTLTSASLVAVAALSGLTLGLFVTLFVGAFVHYSKDHAILAQRRRESAQRVAQRTAEVDVLKERLERYCPPRKVPQTERAPLRTPAVVRSRRVSTRPDVCRRSA